MTGPRMEVTRDAVILFLQSLSPEASFSIISFGSRYDFLEINGDRVLSVRDKAADGVKTLESFEATYGGTEILQPMNKAIELLKEDPIARKLGLKQSRIFLLTDGEVENREDVINAALHRNEKVSIHTFGIGGQCDKDMVKRIAQNGEGSSYLIADVEILQK